MTTFSDLPLEKVEDILRLVSSTDLLNSMFSSITIARLYTHLLPAVRELKIRILNGETRGSYDGTSVDLQVAERDRIEKKILETVLPHLVQGITVIFDHLTL